MFNNNERGNYMDDIKVKSLYKAVKLLDCFTIDSPERGISELAELTKMCKSSVHNIITTFEKCQFIEKNLQNSKYRLGIKILQLNNVLYLTNDLRNTVRPYLEKVSAFSNECVYFAIPTELEVIYLDTVYTSGNTSGRSIIGIKAPMYCTGVGKAIMANLDTKILEQVLNLEMEPCTPYTITDKDKILKELALIKDRGYSVDNMEHEYGIKCVSVAIRNISGNLVGAVSISGPSLRFTDDKILEYADYLINIVNELKGILQK